MLQNNNPNSRGMANSRGVGYFLNRLLYLLLVSTAILASPAAFAHRDVFTNTYTLGTTKPLQFTEYPDFRQISSTASYTLTVQNGAADGTHRISRGEIQLGGVTVIPDTELTALAGTLSKTITLPTGFDRTLKITLKDGAPGAFIQVTLTRHINDSTAPVILLDRPAEEQLFTSSPINVSGNGYDLLDGDTTAYYMDLAEARLNGGAPVHPTPNPTPNGTPNPNEVYDFSLALSPGANSFTLTLKDYEGNVSTLTRRVWLDAAPPQVTLTSPTAGATVTGASLTVTGTATDDTGVTGVTVNGAAATLSSNTFSANVTLSAGANTLTVVATDKANRQTTVTRTVTYGAIPLQVTITNPLSGAALDSDTTLVSGTFSGPPNTGVTVNGVVAETSGTNFYASNVPLLAGANTLTATAASGATAAQSITVTSTGKAPTFQVNADPQSGIAPLKVKFTVTPNTAAALTKIEADYDGNGVIDFTTANPSAPIEYTYTTPGVYQAKLIITDNQNISYTQILVIVVYDAVQMDQKFNALWTGMNDALIAQDVSKALGYLNAQAKTKYGPVFNALLPNMPEIIASYSSLQRVSIASDIGEYAINRTVDGVNRIFFVYFLRDPDGVWRIDAM